MEDRVMKYEKPALDAFCGWNGEFATGGSSVIPIPCGTGAYIEPEDW